MWGGKGTQQTPRSLTRQLRARCGSAPQGSLAVPPAVPAGQQRAKLVICLEFADLEGTAPDGTALTQPRAKPPPAWKPTHGERHIRKELRSLVKQLEMCHAANRRAGFPFDLHVTSWVPDSDIDVFGLHTKADTWAVTRHQAPARDLFPLAQMVMLSPDADEPLLQLDLNKVYCIGGIVDRTVCKGLTAGWASECGMVARRLPVQEHAQALGLGEGTSRSPVLNISDVAAALIRLSRGDGWVAALTAAIPDRKKRPTAPKPKRVRVNTRGSAQ